MMTVPQIQEALRRAGYDPGPIDGDHGIRTSRAIREFQRRNHLLRTGRLGPRGQARLKKVADATQQEFGIAPGLLPGSPVPGPVPVAPPTKPPAPRLSVILDRGVVMMERLRLAFSGLDATGAAAIAGNLGHESGLNPRARGPSGDYGLPQWTGSRKRNFFAYCAKHGYDRNSFDAQLDYVIHELRGPYRSAIVAVKRPGSLMQKVQRFERIYEVAGIKHYANRYRYARMFLAAYQKKHGA